MGPSVNECKAMHTRENSTNKTHTAAALNQLLPLRKEMLHSLWIIFRKCLLSALKEAGKQAGCWEALKILKMRKYLHNSNIHMHL